MKSHELHRKTLKLIGNVIEKRLYVRPKVNPPKEPYVFYLVIRAGKLKCVYCRNLKKEEVRLVKVIRPQRGYRLDEWDALAYELICKAKCGDMLCSDDLTFNTKILTGLAIQGNSSSGRPGTNWKL